jgi:hypothetical protein
MDGVSPAGSDPIKPEAGDGLATSGLKPSLELVERGAARCSALVPCRGRRQTARDRCESSAGLRGTLLGGRLLHRRLLLRNGLCLRCCLSHVISLFCLLCPNQFRTTCIMSKPSYFVDSEQRIHRGMDKLSVCCVASSPQKSRCQVSGIRFQAALHLIIPVGAMRAIGEQRSESGPRKVRLASRGPGQLRAAPSASGMTGDQ